MTASIDLQKFCAGGDDQRTHLRQPWRAPVGIVATDGAVLIVVSETTGDVAEYRPGVHPNVSKMLNDNPVSGPWIALDSIELPPKTVCVRCNGGGQLWTLECPDCGGDGEFDHGSHNYTCRECNGAGVMRDSSPFDGAYPGTCQDCRGDGAAIQPVELPGGTCFQRRYLALLADLPGCEIAPPSTWKAARFRFDGGEGLLMPCR